MSFLLDLLTVVLLLVGSAFFTAGTIGLIRFPDIRSRLHALTKADGLGLGFIVLGVVLQAPSAAVGALAVFAWVAALAAASASARVIAARAAHREPGPRRDPQRKAVTDVDG
ncbi:monovalent cation/H(+) antiporter subunit G [uncultured Corynebacterium sp.]|uniref:cation:proton antiporter n=1 Tax=uncultured Corynebacterium sp. TaxID=159447 RepID=UPI0025DE2882|nr:monovalent cation/H(+) antiporter subunit G [uncultured Corynebacterium sp.]